MSAVAAEPATRDWRQTLVERPAIALTGWEGWLWLSAAVVGVSRLEQIVLIARGGRDLEAAHGFVAVVRPPAG